MNLIVLRAQAFFDCFSKKLATVTRSNKMRPVVEKHLMQYFRKKRPVASVLLLSLFLFVQTLAVSPALHSWFHHDAADADHECAVTLFCHGQVEAASTAPMVFCHPTRFIFTGTVPNPVFVSVDVVLLPSRGPPVSPALV
jgi:hypothetical protein